MSTSSTVFLFSSPELILCSYEEAGSVNEVESAPEVRSLVNNDTVNSPELSLTRTKQ